MVDKQLLEGTKHLFDRDYEAEISREEEDRLRDFADRLIADYGWRDTFTAWNKFLREECPTPESVANFAKHFFWYGGHDHAVPDPYEFLGYLYYRVNLDPEKYGIDVILDTFAIVILPRAGYSEADLVLHPYYMPESDPQILKVVEKLKNS